MVSDFSFLVVTSITVAKVSRHYFRHHIVTGKEFSVITHFRLLPPSFWCASPVLTLPYHKIPQTVWLKPQKLIFSQFRRLEVPGQGPVGWASGEPSSLSLSAFRRAAFRHGLSLVCTRGTLNSLLIKTYINSVTSLVGQWLRICLPMQRAQVRALVGGLRSHKQQAN